MTSIPARGRFITLEGGEGVGKSTQLVLLAKALRKAGCNVVQTREPGGAPGSELLRSMLLHEQVEWSPLAETMLHYAARAEHVAKTIKPALQAGDWVVCDRFTDSTLAYQGAGQGLNVEAIETLSGLIELMPDLTIVLDLSENERLSRLRRRDEAADRYETLPPEFHARVNLAFRDIAARHPNRCVVIPGAGTPDAVHQLVLHAVRNRLGLPQ